MEKIYHDNTSENKVEVPTLTLDKVYFRAKGFYQG
jgi:hypothetical protein